MGSGATKGAAYSVDELEAMSAEELIAVYNGNKNKIVTTLQAMEKEKDELRAQNEELRRKTGQPSQDAGSAKKALVSASARSSGGGGRPRAVAPCARKRSPILRASAAALRGCR